MADFTTFRAVNFLSFLAIPLHRQPWKWLPIHQSNRYSSHSRNRLHYIKSPMYLIPVFHQNKSSASKDKPDLPVFHVSYMSPFSSGSPIASLSSFMPKLVRSLPNLTYLSFQYRADRHLVRSKQGRVRLLLYVKGWVNTLLAKLCLKAHPKFGGLYTKWMIPTKHKPVCQGLKRNQQGA